MKAPSMTARDFDSGRGGAASARQGMFPSFRRSVSIVVAALAGLIVAVPAQARVTHVQTSSFGSFPSLASIAVDRTTGDVYVYDAGSAYGGGGTIEKFDAAGNPVSFTALGSPAGTTNALDGSANGHGDADATPTGMIATYGGPDGAQMAVDNSHGSTQGVIYVVAPYEYVTYAFAPSGAYLGRITDNTAAPYHGGGDYGGNLCGVAVDSSGSVYSSWMTHIDRYVPSGSFAQDSDFVGQIRKPNPTGCRMAGGGPGTAAYLTLPGSFGSETNPARAYAPNQFTGLENPDGPTVGNNVLDLAVDQGSGDVYALESSAGPGEPGDRISVFDAAGAQVDVFGNEGGITGRAGVAVNENNGVAYAHTQANAVGIFTPGVVPDVSTASASSIDRGAAHLNGHVDAVGAGEIQNCHFEYGTDTSYGSTVPCSDATPFSGARDVGANISGLGLDTAYHYRLVGTNSTGPNPGKDLTFRTRTAVLDLRTTEPESVTAHVATLTADFSGDSHDTSYQFEWGPTKAYGQTTAVSAAGATAGPTELSASIESLATFSPYHYRVVATNSFGTTYGADELFFTAPPGPPTISSSSSSDVSATSAVLHAVINPQDGSTVYRFDYGLTGSYGVNTPSSDSIGDDTLDHSAGAELTGLAPGTIYHFRVVAINVGGTTYGPDRSFITPDRPMVSNSGASDLSLDGATLKAQVTPNSSPTTFHFEYGLTTAYGSGTAESAPIGADVAIHDVGSRITGLTPGVTYHYRVVATNSVGRTYGPDLSLTTVAANPGREEATAPPRTCRPGLVRKAGKCVKKNRAHRRHRHHTNRSHG